MQNGNTTQASSKGPDTADPAASGDFAGETKAALTREVEDARQRLSSAGQGLRAEARDAGATVSASVAHAAERGKDDAAEGLRAFSSAIRRASDDLGARDASISARLAREAAEGLERLSDGLQARTMADMSRSIGDFGRQNPAAFLTGCLLAGVAIGRVLVASGDRGYDDGRDDGERYRSGSGYGDWPDVGAGDADYRASRASSDFSPAGDGFGDVAPAGPAGDPPKPAGVEDDMTARQVAGGAATGGRDDKL
jgi:hypothetical protein